MAPSLRPRESGKNDPRLFKVYYPLRTLVLLAGPEALIVFSSFVLATMLRNQDSWLLLNVQNYTSRFSSLPELFCSSPTG